MKVKKRNKKSVSFIWLFVIVFAMSCNTKVIPVESTGQLIIPENAVDVDVEGSNVLLPTFADLTYYSDIIVIAKLGSTLDIVNTARDHDDLTKPDPNYFSVGQVYGLNVETYLKGDGPETINYLESQGFITSSGSPSMEEIQRKIAEAEGKEYKPLRENQTYLLFLRQAEQDYRLGSYGAENMYFGTGHPWQFIIDSQDCVRVDDFISGLDIYFPVQSLAKVKEQIDKPDSSEASPNPYPGPDQECITNATAIPYP